MLFVSYPDPHHPFTPPTPWCDQYDPSDMPKPKVVDGELDLMPDYISEEQLEASDKSYVEFLQTPGRAREQGFMQTTENVSQSSMAQAIAHTQGMISMIDHGVGEIIKSLEAKGFKENTLIIFTSDHGEFLGDHGLLHKGPPPYLALLKVPFIVSGPGVTHGVREQLTSHLDIKATLSEYLSLEACETDGKSFAHLLKDAQGEGQKSIYAEYHPRTNMETYNQSVITDSWRFTIYPERSNWGEMFDLKADPNEHCNLYHNPSYSHIKAKFQQQLAHDFPPASEAGCQSIATY